MKTHKKNIQPIENVLMCGNCIELLEKLDDNSVDLVLTDIPYNEVNRPSGGIQCHGYTIRYNHGEADGANFDINAVLNQLWRICNGSFYIFCGIGQISIISNYFRSMDVNTRLIIYEKTNPLPVNGKHIWLSGIETAVFAKKGGATFNLDCRNTVLRYPIARPTGHPTPKPLNLMRELILASSKKGDVVLDPFMGGGTTPLAALMEGRRYIGIDINNKYCKIAEDRIANYNQQYKLFEQ